MLETRAKAVLEYWFADLNHTPDYFRERMRLWFMGGKKVDEFIRREFLPEIEAAATDELAVWGESPKGALALIILLDQFALNAFRDQARGYQLSDMALPLARKMLDRRWHLTLTPAEQMFVLMPLEHSEAMADQNECVEQFRAMVEVVPLEIQGVFRGSLDYALRHQRVVERFGRFPHRNEQLGRDSTAAEKAFLASDEAPF